jgi:hypothetical protein
VNQYVFGAIWQPPSVHSADRLDLEPVPVDVDELDYLHDWRSSSAPNNADVAFRM